MNYNNQTMYKKFILLFLSVSLFSFLSGSFVQSSSLPKIYDLTKDAIIAQKNKRPILILFSEHDCAYCEIVKDEALVPISKLKNYQNTVIVKEIYSDDVFKGFFNQVSTGSQFLAMYGVDFFPTLLFLNHKGMEIAPRLVGVVDKNIYWQQVDQRITIALSNFR